MSRKAVFRILAGVSIIFLIFSGIIDLFPVINDRAGTLADIKANPDAEFFVNNTPPSAVVLNSSWFYHPASLAGRSIFNGYSYFVWSYGYDQTKRENETVSIYRSANLASACGKLISNNIDFVELSLTAENFIAPDYEFWSMLQPVYTNPNTGLRVYSVNSICRGS